MLATLHDARYHNVDNLFHVLPDARARLDTILHVEHLSKNIDAKR